MICEGGGGGILAEMENDSGGCWEVGSLGPNVSELSLTWS